MKAQVRNTSEMYRNNKRKERNNKGEEGKEPKEFLAFCRKKTRFPIPFILPNTFYYFCEKETKRHK